MHSISPPEEDKTQMFPRVPGGSALPLMGKLVQEMIMKLWDNELLNNVHAIRTLNLSKQMFSYPPDFPLTFYTPQASKERWNQSGSIWVSCCENAHKPTCNARIKETECADAQSKDKLYKVLHHILFKHIFSVITSQKTKEQFKFAITANRLQLIWMQLEVGRWILLWKCVCSAVSLWYTRRFEQTNTCTKPSGKENKTKQEN